MKSKLGNDLLRPMLSAVIALLLTTGLLFLCALAVNAVGHSDIAPKSICIPALFISCLLTAVIRGKREGALPETMLMIFWLLLILLAVAAARGVKDIMGHLRTNALPAALGCLSGGLIKLCNKHKGRK